MEGLFAAVEGSAVAEWLRGGRWSYAAVNALHIFGIALLIGSILPLDLRLLGLWPNIPRRDLARVLVPTAATGLSIALLAGLLLFSIRAGEYAGNAFLQAKLVLAALGIAAALLLHRAHGAWLETAGPARLKAHGLLSLGCWIGALGCGRLIAFTMD